MGFEEAQEALAKADFSQPQQTSEQETSIRDSDASSTQTEGLSSRQAAEIADLEKLGKFKFDGKEWTAKDLKNAYLMHSDYTRKTQALSEERRYAENVGYDLIAVANDPSLAAKFKEIYPKQYHAQLDQVLSYVQKGGVQQSSQPQQSQQRSSVDPDFQQRFERLEKSIQEKEVAAVEAQLDATFSKLSEKYKFADEETVIARAQALLNRGVELNDATWNELFKQINDARQAQYQSFYKAQVGKQQSANVRGKDMGPGGGIPGEAPKKLSLKEVRDYAISQLENRNN